MMKASRSSLVHCGGGEPGPGFQLSVLSLSDISHLLELRLQPLSQQLAHDEGDAPPLGLRSLAQSPVNFGLQDGADSVAAPDHGALVYYSHLMCPPLSGSQQETSGQPE